MKINSFLSQILKFKHNPTYSSVKKIVEGIINYQKEFNQIIIKAQRGKRVEIVDKELFFEYVSYKCGFKIDSFNQIEKILKANSKKENILLTTNSKNSLVKPFDRAFLLRKKGKLAKLYQKKDLSYLDCKSIVAIENSEVFLEVDSFWDKFEQDYFLYLSGNPNNLIKEFLKDKEVLFLIDLDIISLNFYENIQTYKKSLFVPENFDNLLKKFGNNNLYLKQRRFLKQTYSKEVSNIIELIKKEAKVLEQEIFF